MLIIDLCIRKSAPVSIALICRYLGLMLFNICLFADFEPEWY